MGKRLADLGINPRVIAAVLNQAPARDGRQAPYPDEIEQAFIHWGYTLKAILRR